MAVSVEDRLQSNSKDSKQQKYRNFSILALFFNALYTIFKFIKDNKDPIKPLKEYAKRNRAAPDWGKILQPDLAIETETGGVKMAYVKCKNMDLKAAKVEVKPNFIEFDLYFKTPKQHYYKSQLMEKLLEKRNIKRWDSARKRRLRFDELEENSSTVYMI